jgi:hypothetical protein
LVVVPGVVTLDEPTGVTSSSTNIISLSATASAAPCEH